MSLFSNLKQLITQKLVQCDDVPGTYQEMGAWMVKHLGEDRAKEFDLLEQMFGTKKANDWLVGAMMDSGRYLLENDCFVVALRQAA